MMFRLIGLVSLAITLAGCASVSSKQVSYSDGRSSPGLQYSAPKALISVELLAIGDDVAITISEPFLEGDPAATFTMKAISGAFADQDYRFVVDPDTRLLNTVKSDSLGQAGNIIVDLARSGGAAYSVARRTYDESGALSQPRLLYHRIIDPMMQNGCGFGQACSFTELTRDLQSAAQGYLQCGATAAADENLLCAPYRNGEDLFTIKMEPLFEFAQSTSKKKRANTCRKSICYRTPVPYEVRLKVAGVTDVSQVVRLPNKAPLLSLVLPAGLFAEAKSNVILQDGMPTEVKTEKGSEFAEAAGVPLKAIEGFFSGVATISPLKVDFNNNKATEIESQIRLEEARDKQRIAAENRAEERAGRGGYAYTTTANRTYTPSASGGQNESGALNDLPGGLGLAGDSQPTYTRVAPAAQRSTGAVKVTRQEKKLFDITIAGQ